MLVVVEDLAAKHRVPEVVCGHHLVLGTGSTVTEALSEGAAGR